MIAPWLQSVIQTMQQKADEKYQDDLTSYNRACQDWIAANIINRDNGLPVTPFTKPVPARVVFATDGNGNITQTGVIDPAVKAPELPQPKPVVPSVGFQTGAPAQSSKIDEIHMMLSRIYTAMGFGGAK